MGERRLIDANAAIENADKRYSEWNLAMAAAEGNRQISMVYKKQELFKAVRKVIESCPLVDPESMRGHARWLKDENVKIIDVDAYGNTFESPAVYCENCNAALSEADFSGRVWNFCPVCGFKMEDGTNG